MATSFNGKFMVTESIFFKGLSFFGGVGGIIILCPVYYNILIYWLFEFLFSIVGNIFVYNLCQFVLFVSMELFL